MPSAEASLMSKTRVHPALGGLNSHGGDCRASSEWLSSELLVARGEALFSLMTELTLVSVPALCENWKKAPLSLAPHCLTEQLLATCGYLNLKQLEFGKIKSAVPQPCSLHFTCSGDVGGRWLYTAQRRCRTFPSLQEILLGDIALDPSFLSEK